MNTQEKNKNYKHCSGGKVSQCDRTWRSTIGANPDIKVPSLKYAFDQMNQVTHDGSDSEHNDIQIRSD